MAFGKLMVAGLAAMAATGVQAERLVALTDDGRIVTFDSATPDVIRTSGQVLGLGAGETLTGLDLRPATRGYYSVSTTGNLYRVDKNSSGRDFTATLVGSLGVGAISGANGIDFNPVPDRLRLITTSGQNFRINVDTLATITDTPINGVAGLSVVAAAYTNSRPGVTTTMLYAINGATDSLVRSTNPNGGVYTTNNLGGQAFGSLGFSTAGGPVSFDVSGGSGAAFASAGDRLFSVNLTTGAATELGSVGTSLRGLTASAVPEPATWAMMIMGFGLVGAAMRRRTAAAVAA